MLITSSKDNKPKSPFSFFNILAGLIILAGVVVLVKPGMSDNKPAKEEALFSLAGEPVTIDQLPHRYRQQYFEIAEQTYQRQRKIIATAATELYIQQQIEETGDDKQTVIKKLFDPKPPTMEQVQTFYQQNRQRINGSFEQSKNQIALILMSQAQQQKQAQLLDKLNELGEFELYLTEPEAPFITIDTAGYPSKGPADAKVTLIEFGDYQCGHCRNSFMQLKDLLPQYEDKVRFVYMDFPINSSGISRKIAEGAVCADQQGQYWPFHTMAFQRQSALSENSPGQFAEELGLDARKFAQCMALESTRQKVHASAEQAVAAGVTGTPTFFLNGIKLSDEDRARSFKALLDEAIEVSELHP